MDSNKSVKVYIVDDAPSVRESLCELMHGVEGVAVVGEAESPALAIAGIFETRPDYVILDYRLIGGTGIDVLRAVHANAPEIVFVMLTNYPSPQYRQVCMNAGASHFFDKSTEFHQVRDLVSARVRKAP